MQRLEVSGAVRPLYGSLGFKELIIVPHLHLSLLRGLLPSGFPTKTLYTPLLSPTHVKCSSILIILYLINRIMFGDWQRSVCFLLMQFSPLPCSVVPLSPKYSPQHPNLEHPQPTFFPQYGNKVSHPYKTQAKLLFLYILSFLFYLEGVIPLCGKIIYLL